LVIDSIPSQSKLSLTATEYPAIPLLDTEKANAEQAAANANPNGGSTNPPAKVLAPFTTAREQALKQASDGDLKGALVALTEYYNSPELPSSEYSDLLEILDALAREVIYSKRHLVLPAYVATVGETVGSVAAKHNLTPELVANINQLGSSNVLIQDQQLKVLEGPFRGEVDLTRGELTLFLKDMYAGRFPISVGSDPAPKSGHYEVADKRRDRSYYGAENKVINANDPQNPYGGIWIDLGHDLCIHGTAEMVTTDMKSVGCISLSPIDAADVFIMLTRGSQIDIR
jgi:LysM repeat protein